MSKLVYGENDQVTFFSEEEKQEAIEYYGSIKGTLLAIKRILKCNPVSKGGVDLVPKK